MAHRFCQCPAMGAYGDKQPVLFNITDTSTERIYHGKYC
jgi:hypothetical protein